MEGYISQIDFANKTFILNTETDALSCSFSQDYEIKQYQLVTVEGECEGNILTATNIVSKNIVMTEDLMTDYDKMAKILNKEGRSEKLTEVSNIKEPSTLRSIALLVGAESTLSTETWISEFNDRCSGIVSIYRMNHNDLANISKIVTMFEESDMIVCLCDDMTDVEICLISCRDNIKYFIGRPRDVYFTVVDNNRELKPLIAKMCNKVFISTEACISFIKKIQSQELVVLNDIRNTLVNDLKSIPAEYRRKAEYYKANISVTGLITPMLVKNLLRLQVNSIMNEANKLSALAMKDISAELKAIEYYDAHSLEEDDLRTARFITSDDLPDINDESSDDKSSPLLQPYVHDNILLQNDYFRQNKNKMIHAHNDIWSISSAVRAVGGYMGLKAKKNDPDN